MLIAQGLTRSIQRELNSFYQKLTAEKYSIHYVTKSAFSKSRKKLNPEAFVELNKVGLDSFYKNAPYRTWKGFRLLAIDGSTAVLPDHVSIQEEFPVCKFGRGAASSRSLARLSVLYDVLNLTVLDGNIGTYSTSERALSKAHFQHIDIGNDLLILDRGYPSLPFLYELQSRGINFLMRMKGTWWLEVRKMIAAGETDKVVNFHLPAKNQAKISGLNSAEGIKCRLIVIKLADGSTEVLCTSVIDKQILPYDSFAELYHYRWNIEEGFKLFKNRLQLEAFSGKTALAVKQDFFAKLFMLTATAILSFPVDERIKEEHATTNRKHPHQVNRTNALSMVKELIPSLIIKRIIKPCLKALDIILRKTTELIRPNRHYKRHKIQKKPPSQCYKQL